MQLTQAQAAILSKMADGWALHRSMTIDGGFWLQSRGPGASTSEVRWNVAHALLDRALIEKVAESFPRERYALTDTGRAALVAADIKPPRTRKTQP